MDYTKAYDKDHVVPDILTHGINELVSLPNFTFPQTVLGRLLLKLLDTKYKDLKVPIEHDSFLTITNLTLPDANKGDLLLYLCKVAKILQITDVYDNKKITAYLCDKLSAPVYNQVLSGAAKDCPSYLGRRLFVIAITPFVLPFVLVKKIFTSIN
mgnify:CR=1 FL=1